MAVDLHPEARAELRLSAIWYDERRPGLGDEFVSEVMLALDRVTRDPAAFPVWTRLEDSPLPIRRALLERFPFALAFEVRQDQVFVLAIAHAKRRPLYWLDRAAPSTA